MKLTTRELSPKLWPAVESLFGPKGACGGCWCMSWRIAKGEKWEAVKGETARDRFRALVQSGAAHGVLAFDGAEPVGWCAFDRRPDFAKLDRAPSFACDDAAEVWSIPCFFIQSGRRGQGVATALLAAALAALRKRGARIVEGYPAKPSKTGAPIPGAFAWTGTQSLFEKAGFTLAGDAKRAKLRMRRRLP
ncbi:MAG: GNAT family N-acetyltransferase [Planctomycetes bacterium]|nr:GNAT family N-acetyltransferase [Planctomycetota bacterium]